MVDRQKSHFSSKATVKRRNMWDRQMSSFDVKRRIYQRMVLFLRCLERLIYVQNCQE